MKRFAVDGCAEPSNMGTVMAEMLGERKVFFSFFLLVFLLHDSRFTIDILYT